ALILLIKPLLSIIEVGEQEINYVGRDRAPTEASQTPRWEVKEGAEGFGDTQRSHIFVTVTDPGLTMGLVVTTTRRTYYITCKSVKTSLTRVLRWRYPSGTAEAAKPVKPPGLLP